MLFHLGGYSSEIGSEPARRRIVSPATFATEDDSYRWLNDVVAIGEGVIDFRTLRLTLRYHAAIPEIA